MNSKFAITLNQIKSIIFASALLTLTMNGAVFAEGQVSSAQEPDCATAAVKLRKAKKTIGNLVLKQWACAAASQVDFSKRDTDPTVLKLVEATTLYKEVGASEKQQYCISLVDQGEKTESYLLVVVKDGVHTPKYQSTAAIGEED